jgi:very-short-patch-repair endonuclease
VNGDLERALATGDGLVNWPESGLPRHVVDYAVSAGQLIRVGRGIYATTRDTEHPLRAALLYLGPHAFLSHTTALAVWGLTTASTPIHVTVPPHVRRRGGQDLVVHRREAVDGVIRAGLRVTRLEASIVDSWPLLPAEDRRRPVIEAVASRRTTVDRLNAALTRVRRINDRRALRRTLDLLAAGCHSPLEIWGLEHVFNAMPALQRQVPMRIGSRSVYLDVYAPAEKVNFELDGSHAHQSTTDRERDLRRDAALAAQGILVVRFTYRRLVAEPGAVRSEVRAILAARRVAAA